jgi:molybdopterin-binding protein
VLDVRAENLGRLAGGKPVLDDVSLEFEAGAANVVLGANGAGKTTLLRLLSLLDPPGRGDIFYDGSALAAMGNRERTALRRRIGFVFQSPLLLNGTVADNLLYGPRLRGIDVSAAAAARVLREMGLEGRENQEAGNLSGGEKQRLQLARVMLLDPELYLLDEPTANLDPLSVKNIEAAITSLVRLGRTVIMATHNLIQARLLAGKVFFLKAGSLLQAGPAAVVLDRPFSLDIAEFSAAENVLSGTLARRDGFVVLECGPLAVEVVSERERGRATAVIRPEDILVSRGPLSSSARNSFLGSIGTVVDLGPVVSLRVDCGGVGFTVFVTRHSRDQLDLRPGAEVVLTFKATSVHLLPSG